MREGAEHSIGIVRVSAGKVWLLHPHQWCAAPGCCVKMEDDVPVRLCFVHSAGLSYGELVELGDKFVDLTYSVGDFRALHAWIVERAKLRIAAAGNN